MIITHVCSSDAAGCKVLLHKMQLNERKSRDNMGNIIIHGQE